MSNADYDMLKDLFPAPRKKKPTVGGAMRYGLTSVKPGVWIHPAGVSIVRSDYHGQPEWLVDPRGDACAFLTLREAAVYASEAAGDSDE